MPYTDLPLDELRAHRSTSREPDDFDARWRATLQESARLAEPSTVVPVETGLAAVETKEIVEYNHNGHEGGAGFQQQRQLAWLRERMGSDRSAAPTLPPVSW